MMMDMAGNAQDSIARELHAWLTTGLRIAIWGSGLDAQRFPIIVDSDWLLDHPVDIILIPCQFQAADIVRQIDAAHITYEGILVPQDGRLVDFHAAGMILA
jgi:hypothetical protein